MLLPTTLNSDLTEQVTKGGMSAALRKDKFTQHLVISSFSYDLGPGEPQKGLRSRYFGKVFNPVTLHGSDLERNRIEKLNKKNKRSVVVVKPGSSKIR